MQTKGKKCVTHVAGDKEYWEKLKVKLREEAGEFTTDQTPEELADVIEVLRTICEYKNWSWAEVDQIRLKKREERGGFDQRIILDESEN